MVAEKGCFPLGEHLVLIMNRKDRRYDQAGPYRPQGIIQIPLMGAGSSYEVCFSSYLKSALTVIFGSRETLPPSMGVPVMP